MTEPLGISIIVVNYNNGRFLAAAIDSALSQDHPLCEVIVVDDCSADDSRAVIARYGDRIRSILRETNGHQIAALNTAWPLALYPILIFLDSDDLLLRHAASTIAGAWTAETVKAQYPLVTVDMPGNPSIMWRQSVHAISMLQPFGEIFFALANLPARRVVETRIRDCCSIVYVKMAASTSTIRVITGWTIFWSATPRSTARS